MAILGFPSTSIIDSTSAGRALLTAANAAAQRTLLGLGTSDSPTFTALVLSGQSLTGSSSTSVFDASTTWDTTGTPTAWKLNVTDTNSGGNPLLIDLQANGFSRFDVTAKIAATYIGQFSHNGLPRVRFSAQSSGAAIEIFSGSENSFIGFGTIGSTDVRLYRDSNTVLAQRNGVNSQIFRLYNTFTSSTNYERGKLAWEIDGADPVLRIGTEKGSGGGTARALQFQTDGTTRLTIASTGSVTVNNPVFAVSGDNPRIVLSDSDGTTRLAGIEFSTLGGMWSAFSNNDFWIGYTTLGTIPTSGSYLFLARISGAAAIGTNGVERFRIAGTGEVGIGTSSPSARLDIAGTADSVQLRVKAHTTQTNNIQEWWAASAALYTAAITPSCGFFTRAATAFEVSNGRLFQLTADSNTFNIRDGSAAVTRVTISSTGNVGIGTTSPSSTLHVSAGANAGLIVGTNNNQNIFQYLKGDGTNLIRGTWDGSNFHHYMNGNLYYNLNGFGFTFDGNSVGGPISISGNAWIALNSATTIAPGNANIWAGPNAYATVGNQLTSISPFAFSTWAWNGTNGFSITSRGYLKQTQQSAVTGDARLSIVRGADNVELFTVNYSNGNVGVGTTSPSERLHVENLSGVAAIKVNGSSDSYVEVNRSGIAGSRGILGTNYVGTFYNADFNIYANSIMHLSLRAGTGFLKFNTANSGILAGDTSFSIKNSGNTATNVYIEDAGNIGIGNTAPSQKVHITGNLRVTGAYYDSTNSAGTSGQVLKSTATGTDWVDPYDLVGVNADYVKGVEGNRFVENLQTGVLYGGVITINALDNSKVDISAGVGVIVSPGASTTALPVPTVTTVTWTAKTAVTLTYLATSEVTWFSINSSGNVVQSPSAWSDSGYQTELPLGIAVHPNNTSISFAKPATHLSYGQSTLVDPFVRAFGPLKLSGNTISAYSTNLQISRSAGTSYSIGSNYVNDPNNPNIVSDTNANPISAVHYYFKNGSGGFNIQIGSLVDPTKYDNGSGTLQTASGGKYTIQRIFSCPTQPTLIGIYYGSQEYNSIEEAEANIPYEVFSESDLTSNQGVFCGYLIVKANTTNLSVAADAKFIQAGLFRSVSTVTAGGQAITALDDLTDVVITSPVQGNFLRYNAANSSWVNGTGVDGTGTTNYVPKWSDSDTLANSLIFDNGTNVGIGTTSPSERFHIEGSSARILLDDTNQMVGDQETALLTLKHTVNNSEAPSGRFDDLFPHAGISFKRDWTTTESTLAKIQNYGEANWGGGLAIFTKDDDGSSSSSPLLTMDLTPDGHVLINRGNVGIGATTTSARLHVVGTGTSSSTLSLRIVNSTPTDLLRVADDGRMIFGPSSNTPRISAYSPNGGDGVTPNLTAQAHALLFYTDYTGPTAGNGTFTFNAASGSGFSHSVNNDISALVAFRGTVLNSNATTDSRYTSLSIATTINQTAGTSTVRGIWYSPTVTSATGVTHRAIETTRGDILFQNVSTPLFFVQESSGNVSVGTSSPSGRLHSRGSGAIAGAYALWIENSTPNQLLFIENNGIIHVGHDAQRSQIYPYSTSGGLGSLGTLALTGDLGIAVSSRRASGGTTPGGVFLVTRENSSTATSGSDVLFVVGHKPTLGFAPTSGTTTFTAALIYPIINQTGGANGITRGVYVNPTLTAAADWRSVETSNNTGWAFYGAGTANSYFGGNVGIGTTSTLARLHVKGSGNTSATFGINLEDSGGLHVFRVRDDGGIHVGPTVGATSGAFISASDGADNIGTTVNSGLRYRSALGTAVAGADHFFRNYQGNRQYSSGIGSTIQVAAPFYPTSGTGVWAGIQIDSTINQTGGANGITRGLWINSNLIAVANWRSIETNNNTGWAFYGAGTANSYFGGNVGIGNAAPSYAIDISGTTPAIRVNNAAGNQRILVGSDGSGSFVGTFSNNDLRFFTNSTEKARITATGEVGIGTASPTALLMLSRASGNNVDIKLDQSGIATWTIQNLATSANLSISHSGLGAAITVLGASGNVGIGTTSPAPNGFFASGKTLHISQTTSPQYPNIRLTTTNNDSSIGVDDTFAYLVTNKGWRIYTGAGPTEVMRVGSDGNVGIGATPTCKLDVAGTIEVKNGVNPQTLNVYNTYSGAGANYERGKFGWSGSSVFQIGTEKLGTGAARSLDLQTDAITRLRIASDGYLFLGNGGSNNIRIYNQISGAGILEADTNGIAFDCRVRSGTAATSAFWVYYGNDCTASSHSLGRFSGGFNPTSGNADHTNLLLNMTINQTGGANGITRGLWVNPTLTAAADWRSIQTSNNTGYAFYAAGTAVSYFGGRVGIGTTAPSNALQVDVTVNASDGIYFRNQSTGVSAFSYVAAANNNSDQVDIRAYGSNHSIWPNTGFINSSAGLSNGLVFWQAGNAPFRFFTNSSERLRIDGSGNVGIGTTSPSTLLHVLTATAEVDFLRLTASGQNLSLKYMATPNSFVFTSSAGRNINLFNDGNVGIGFDTAPSQKLHISGNIRVTGAYYDSNNSAGTSGQILASTGTGTDWVTLSEITGVDGSGTLNYITKWTPDGNTIGNSQIFDDGTNVGIGTASPSEKFQIVNGNILLSATYGIRCPDNFRLYDTTNSIDRFLFSSNNSYNTRSGGEHRFQINGSQVVVINSSGNVGIGTASPLYPLDVRKTNQYSAMIHFNGGATPTDAGGYLWSYADDMATLAAGSVYDTSGNLTAKATTASDLYMYQGRVSFRSNTGLTVGASYTPTTRFTIAPDGSTGIGSNWAKGEKCYVAGGALILDNNQSIKFVDSTDNNRRVVLVSSANDCHFGPVDSGWGATTYLKAGGSIVFTVNQGSPSVHFMNSGRVGIGTSGPQAKLQIVDTVESGSGSLAVGILDLAQTWNTSGTPTAIKLNVTEVQSNPNSLLMDLQVGGSSRFKVEKSGSAVVTSNLYLYGTGDADVSRTGVSQWSSGARAGFVVGGVFRFIAVAGYVMQRSDSAYSWSPDSNLQSQTPDLLLYRDAAGVLAQRNGLNAQVFRVYNTFTSDTNYERGKFSWETDAAIPVLRIGTEKGSVGGTARALQIQTDGTTRITVAATGAVTFAGAVNISSSTQITYDGTSLSTTTATSITTFAAATYGSAEYLVQVRDTVTGQRQVSKILIVHDGTTAYSTEYGVVFTGTAALATFTVDISAGNVRLLAAGATANSTEYKILKTNLVV